MASKPEHQKFAIIVAGGSGSRMGSTVPKQFVLIGQRPILMRTIERFVQAEPTVQIVLVLPAAQIRTWHELCEQHDFRAKLSVVPGGDTRFQSVRNGLKQIAAAEGVVAIHDGVRPFVSLKTIQEGYQVAIERGNAVAAVLPKDSVRILHKAHSRALDRAEVRLVQTPQTFDLALLRLAFEQAESPAFTDDASVVESAGHSIHLIEGSYHNIKITTPDDLLIAEAFLANQQIA
jgi:2-C-methyl-D-erythritol 4-phosphate cytidylyltransferase